MLLFHSATHSASDKKIITRLGAPARYAAVSFNETNHANRNRHGPGCAAHFSADYADFEPIRSPAQSAIKPLHPFDLRLLGSNKSDQRKLRNGRCCGEIAKRTHHRFQPTLSAFAIGKKCTPSTTQSVLSTRKFPRPGFSTIAQSSPGPLTTAFASGRPGKSWRSSRSSPISRSFIIRF